MRFTPDIRKVYELKDNLIITSASEVVQRKVKLQIELQVAFGSTTLCQLDPHPVLSKNLIDKEKNTFKFDYYRQHFS